MNPDSADIGVHLGQLAGLLFTMMGPIAVMPAFAGITAGADDATCRRIALRATLYAAVAVVLAVMLGYGVLTSWGASKPALVLAAGLLLLFASVGQVLGGAKPPPPPAAAPRRVPGIEVAVSPLAFPTIVTPHAVGVLIIFASFFPTFEAQRAIAAAALGIVLLNLFAMFAARRFVGWVGEVPLRILGAVFGVLQVALGVEFLLSGLRLAGVVT